MDTVSLMYEKFNDITAAKTITFLQYPKAKMMKHDLALQEVLKFDIIDWSEPKTLYGFAHIGNHESHYLTYGGGPEGGIVKSYGDSWYVWHRDWATKATSTRIPDELDII